MVTKYFYSFLSQIEFQDSCLVRAPGLEPKSSSKEPFLLLREISTQCLEDIRKGKTGTVKQLLTLLSGVKQ